MSPLLQWFTVLSVMARVFSSPLQSAIENDEQRQGVLLPSPVCARLSEFPRRFERQSLDYHRDCQCVDSRCALCGLPERFPSPALGSPTDLHQKESSSNLPQRFYARSHELTCQWADTNHRACNYSLNSLDGPSCDCSVDDPDVTPLEIFSTFDHQCTFSTDGEILEFEDFSGSGDGSGFYEFLIEQESDFSGNEHESTEAEDMSGDFSGSIEELTEELF